MLQQTRMEVVLPYFRAFVKRFPTLQTLAAATDEEVTAAWSGLGYYRRARMLRAGAALVAERFGGRVPDDVETLMTIPGIGRYTAGAIASVAYDRRAPIVDGNVARIVSRLFGIEAAVGSPALMREAWRRAEELVAACASPRAFNQGLMEAGALICTPRRPSCETCPVESLCVARATGRVDDLPRPKAKKTPTAMTIALYLVTDGDGRVLMRREHGPLMDGMYHLPHGDASLLTGTPLAVRSREKIGAFRHTVTTRKIEFELFAAEPRLRIRDCDGGEYVWIDPRELRSLPHPSYVAKALRLWTAVRSG